MRSLNAVHGLGQGHSKLFLQLQQNGSSRKFLIILHVQLFLFCRLFYVI